MKQKFDSIDQYLKGVDLRAEESTQHRQETRRRIVFMIERKQKMVNHRTFKIILAILAILGGGALATAVGVKIHRFYFLGKDPEGVYVFESEPEVQFEKKDANGMTTSITTTSSVVSMGQDPNNPRSVEQMQEDIDTMAVMADEGNRTLKSVVETQVNGHVHQAFVFEYTLPDGRTIRRGEGAGKKYQRTAEQIAADTEEMNALRKQGLGQVDTLYETEANGHVFKSCSMRYILADGRELTCGESYPYGDYVHPEVMLSDALRDEMFKMRTLEQGQDLGKTTREIQGQSFVFETTLYTLSDGTDVTYATGHTGLKTRLKSKDREEMRALMEGGEYEKLPPFEREIQGQWFQFDHMQFELSDGTEVIRAIGRPKE